MCCSPATPASRAAGWRSGCCELGADVSRLRPGAGARAHPVRPAAALAGRLDHHVGDLRDPAALSGAGGRHASPRWCCTWRPSPWCGAATAIRCGTWATNVMGTLHLLEALRPLHHPCAVVMVTTDKVYAQPRMALRLPGERSPRRPRPLQRQQGRRRAGHRQLARQLLRRRCPTRRPTCAIATRPGRQRDRRRRLGGRPDRARCRCAPWRPGSPIAVRNPGATRPWQHVLEPLGGYLLLAEALRRSRRRRRRWRKPSTSGPSWRPTGPCGSWWSRPCCHWPGTLDRRLRSRRPPRGGPAPPAWSTRPTTASAGRPAGISPPPSRAPLQLVPPRASKPATTRWPAASTTSPPTSPLPAGPIHPMTADLDQLKQEILRLTRDYCAPGPCRLPARRRSATACPDTEGQPIPYAGRVFTEDEVEAAVGSHPRLLAHPRQRRARRWRRSWRRSWGCATACW